VGQLREQYEDGGDIRSHLLDVPKLLEGTPNSEDAGTAYFPYIASLELMDAMANAYLRMDQHIYHRKLLAECGKFTIRANCISPEELQAEVERLQSAARANDHEASQLRRQIELSTSDQETTRQQLSEHLKKISSLDQQLEEITTKELQARTHNKTLREELRKVQSSAAILSRQRGPGVGYWSPGNNSGTNRPPSPTSSQTAGSPGPDSSNDEDVNVEYLRNVILQFLEHKEMRPNLVRVLSTILRFTPQETRRLIAKV